MAGTIERERHDVTRERTGPASSVRLAALGLAVVVAGGVAAAVMSPLFSAELGPIDDHQPLRWMGRDSRLGWSEIPGALITDTEVGAFGGDGRFRPAYFFGRLIQTAALGDHASLWYLSVLAVFAITCGVTGYTFSRWASAALNLDDLRAQRLLLVVASIGGSALVLSLPAWRGVILRLGPSEQLGMLAVALVVLGLSEVGLDTNASRRWWWLTSVAAAVAAMSKENLIGVGAIVAGVAAMGWRVDGDRRWLVATVAAPLGLVGLAMLRIGASGNDIYGRSTGFERFHGLIESMSTPLVTRWLWSLGLVVFAAAVLTMVTRSGRTVLVAIGCVTFVVVTDIVVTGARYGPARYQILIQYVTLAQTTAAAVLFLAAWRRSKRRAFGVLAMLVAVILAWGWGASLPQHLDRLHQVADANRGMTIRFRDAVDETVVAVDRGDQFAVVGVSANNYELTLSVLGEVWRRADSPTRGFLLLANEETQTSDLAAFLDSRLSELARSGDVDRHIRSLDELQEGRALHCVAPSHHVEIPSACSGQSIAGPSSLP